jgi:hypothetical protein
MTVSYTVWAWPWWTTIVIINFVNLVFCAIVYKRSLFSAGVSDTVYLKRMRIMGLIFTLVGAYRAVFVSRYLTQMAWFDSVLNSSLVIRVFAIAAELSFSGLIALGMLKVNADLPSEAENTKNKFTLFMKTKSPYILWSCIFAAQFFATAGVITKSRTSFAIEETLWTVGFLSVLPLAIIQVRRVFSIKDKKTLKQIKIIRRSVILIAAWCVVYCSYGLFYHLPLESWAGAFEQIETGFPAIKTGTGAVFDAFTIVNESKEYSDWGIGFLFWHSAYFTVCVWISIFLMQGPRIIGKERGIS